MDYAPKTFADGTLPATKTTLFTSPALTSAIIRSVILVNTGVAAVTVNMYANFGTGSRLITPKDLSLGPGVKYEEDFPLSLEAGQSIEGIASASNTVDYIISGVSAV